MNKSRLVTGIIVVVLVIAGLIIAVSRGGDEPEMNGGGNGASADTYESAEFGFSFERPDGYNLLEVPDGESGRFSVVLSRIEDSDIPENGEGPTAITVDAFPDADGESIRAWLEDNQISNYSLITGAVSDASVDGEPALRYSWDGLYRGRSVALMHDGNVILISGTYLEESDPIFSDFDEVVESFELE